MFLGRFKFYPFLLRGLIQVFKCSFHYLNSESTFPFLGFNKVPNYFVRSFPPLFGIKFLSIYMHWIFRQCLLQIVSYDPSILDRRTMWVQHRLNHNSTYRYLNLPSAFLTSVSGWTQIQIEPGSYNYQLYRISSLYIMLCQGLICMYTAHVCHSSTSAATCSLV